MHKLDRSGVAAPDCLNDYNYLTQNWANFGGQYKKALRAALVQMQGTPGVTTEDAAEYGVRCAYCEGEIRHGGHIEHFRCKNPKHHPHLTFDWDNLFLACGSKSHCGHYKDHKQEHDPDQLIKPDEHDPEDFLYFHSSGEVRVREGLNGADKLRAETTILVFGSNDPALTSQRKRAVHQYRKLLAEDFEYLASWSEVDRKEYLEGEIEATQWQPYATTIKHFLQRT